MPICHEALATAVADLPATHPAVLAALTRLEAGQHAHTSLVDALLAGPFASAPIPDALAQSILCLPEWERPARVRALLGRPGTVTAKVGEVALRTGATVGEALADERIGAAAKERRMQEMTLDELGSLCAAAQPTLAARLAVAELLRRSPAGQPMADVWPRPEAGAAEVVLTRHAVGWDALIALAAALPDEPPFGQPGREAWGVMGRALLRTQRPHLQRLLFPAPAAAGQPDSSAGEDVLELMALRHAKHVLDALDDPTLLRWTEQHVDIARTCLHTAQILADLVGEPDAEVAFTRWVAGTGHGACSEEGEEHILRRWFARVTDVGYEQASADEMGMAGSFLASTIPAVTGQYPFAAHQHWAPGRPGWSSTPGGRAACGVVLAERVAELLDGWAWDAGSDRDVLQCAQVLTVALETHPDAFGEDRRAALYAAARARLEREPAYAGYGDLAVALRGLVGLAVTRGAEVPGQTVSPPGRAVSRVEPDLGPHTSVEDTVTELWRVATRFYRHGRRCVADDILDHVSDPGAALTQFLTTMRGQIRDHTHNSPLVRAQVLEFVLASRHVTGQHLLAAPAHAVLVAPTSARALVGQVLLDELGQDPHAWAQLAQVEVANVREEAWTTFGELLAHLRAPR